MKLVKLVLIGSLIMGVYGCGGSDLPQRTPDGMFVTQPVDHERGYKEIVTEQKEIIRRQQEEIRRQDSEIQDLKRQQYHNESLRRFE